MNTLTATAASKRGYRLVRGSYAGTTDDRADRWYIDHDGDTVIDHRGSGFPTKAAALEYLYEGLLLRGEL